MKKLQHLPFSWKIYQYPCTRGHPFFNCIYRFFWSLDSQFISTLNIGKTRQANKKYITPLERELLWAACRHPATSWEKIWQNDPCCAPRCFSQKIPEPFKLKVHSWIVYPVVTKKLCKSSWIISSFETGQTIRICVGRLQGRPSDFHVSREKNQTTSMLNMENQSHFWL